MIGTILCRVLNCASISSEIFFTLFWDTALDFLEYLALLFSCSVGFSVALNCVVQFFSVVWADV